MRCLPSDFRPFLLAAASALTLLACEPAPKSQEDEAADPKATVTREAPTLDLAALAAAAPKGRLPAGVAPTAYDLALTLDPREETFSGSVTITIRMDSAREGIWLHGNGMTITQALVEAEGVPARPAAYAQVLPSGVSWLGFGETIPAGTVKATLVYTAPFDANLAGLFRVEEQGDAYALAKSESIQARKFLPGFDEPGLKAPYTVSLKIPEGYEAIANTPERSREPAGDGTMWVYFAPTRPLSSFLLSLAVGPFDRVDHSVLPPNEIRERSIPLRGFARRGRGEELKLILDITQDFVEIFERSLGVPYPYAKLDIVAAPQWPSGATELAGAITYREERILVGENAPPGVRRGLFGLHAHELAHMWFGNLVTPPWWDDLWLKEGFATWGTPLVLEQYEPEGGHGLDATSRALSAMRQDALSSVRAVREPISVNEDIRNAYTAIPYSKGMAIIRMVETAFGVEAFRKALGDYIRTHEDGAADSDAFFETIGTVTGEPALTKAFRSFVEQKGVPVIETALDCDGDVPSVTLTQSRYRPLGSAVDDAARWTVPLCLGHPGEEDQRRTCTIMEEKTLSLPLETGTCPAWIMPNADGTGYYRYALSPEGWAGLGGAFAALSPAEQLTAVDSAVAGYEAGRVGPEATKTVLTQAAAAPVRQVATAPLRSWNRYIDILDGTPGAGPLKETAGALYGPRLAALEGDTSAEAGLLSTSLETFLALTAEDEAIRARLADAAVRFVGVTGEREPNALSADQYRTALVVAVQDLKGPFVDALLEARETIDDPRFDGASAAALGAVRDADLAAEMLDYALSGQLGSREAFSIIEGLMRGAETRETTWTWLKDNIAAVTETIPAQWRRFLPGLPDSFCDPARASEIETFFTENAELMPGYQRRLTQTLERLSLCAATKTRLMEAPIVGAE